MTYNSEPSTRPSADSVTIPDRPVLTVGEVADLFGASRWLVQQAARTGELPTIRLGRRILFPRMRILALLDPPADASGEAASHHVGEPQPVVHNFAARARSASAHRAG